MILIELINGLNRMKVETGSLVCLGCGHENSCGTRGCAIIRKAAAKLEILNGVENGDMSLYFAARILRSTPERLRALAEADRAERLFFPPVKVGDLLYPIWKDEVAETWLISEPPERVNEVGSMGFFVSGSYSDPEAPDEFHPYEEIGKEYFLSREAAEAAIAKLEEGKDVSKDYPCAYYYDDGKCKKFSGDGVTNYCVLGPCGYDTWAKHTGSET